MLDPWTFTASAQRMRERDLAKLPLEVPPRHIAIAPALAIAAGLGGAVAGVVYGGMLLAVYLFGAA